MRIRIIARFKNDHFVRARIDAGFPTIRSLAFYINMNENTVQLYENFKAYPRKLEIIGALESALFCDFEELFPKEYRDAVDLKMGKTIQAVEEIKVLPEYAARGLLPAVTDPQKAYETKELKGLMKEALQYLSLRESQVIQRRFNLDGQGNRTLAEIAKELNVSQERIRQMESKALRKLSYLCRSDRFRGQQIIKED